MLRRRFEGGRPAGLEPGSPFGPNLRAFVLYLHFGQAMPFERLARLMWDLFELGDQRGGAGQPAAAQRAGLAAQASLIKQRLLYDAVLASDETSVRVGKKTFWTWVFHRTDSACLVMPSRGKAAVGEFLGDVRHGIWISDRLSARMSWPPGTMGVPRPSAARHPVRDRHRRCRLRPGMKHLLQRAVRMGHRHPALTDAALAALTAPGSSAPLDDVLRIMTDGERGLNCERSHRALPPATCSSSGRPRGVARRQRVRTGPAALVIFRKITDGCRSASGRRPLRRRPLSPGIRPTTWHRHPPCPSACASMDSHCQLLAVDPLCYPWPQ